MKLCTKCGKQKPDESFWKHSGMKGGLHPWCIECIKARRRELRLLNPEKYRFLARKSYYVHRERKLAEIKKYYLEHRVQLGQYQKERSRNLRLKALIRLGNKCIRCGFSDPRALQIDHISGGGNKWRQANQGCRDSFHLIILKMSEEELKTKYQLLCANCNWIKKSEEGEVRLAKKKTR